jgi:hypothetical protein
MVQADPKDAIIRKQIERIHFGWVEPDYRCKTEPEINIAGSI